MKTETIALPALNSGASHFLTVQRFGAAGARPQIYIQASLHADEIPGMICAVKLRERLLACEAAGEIMGEIVLVPVANPLGLGQSLFGHPVGRFAMADGGNFNRDYPWLTPGTQARIEGKLGPDAAANAAIIREALAAEVEAWPAATQAAALKKELVRLAIGADIVLDLHCDAEAAMHLYTQTTSADMFAPLGGWLGSVATLVAEESGGDPFDEVFSRPWVELRKRLPLHPIPLGCHSVTVELRGQADISHEDAGADAAAILAFLQHLGAVAGAAPPLPGSPAAPTPLAAAEPLFAANPGIIVFRRQAGEMIMAGDVVADIVDPVGGAAEQVVAQSSGILFARTSARFAHTGKRLGKIAGATLRRSGKLLSA